MAMCGMKSAATLIAGAAAGAVLLYLFDPDKGAGRREHLADTWDDLTVKARHLGDSLIDQAAGLSHKAAHGAEGAAHAMGTAAHVAGDVAAQAGGAATSAAATLGEALTARARHYAAHLNDMASHARKYLGSAPGAIRQHASDSAEDVLQSVHPHSHHSAAGYGLTAAGALALGLTAMYLLDSESGDMRRHQILGGISDVVGQAGEAFHTSGKYVRQQFDRLMGEWRGERSQQMPETSMAYGSEDWRTSNSQESAFPWQTTVRIGVGVVGGTLGFWGATRRDWIGLGMGVVGLGIIASSLVSFDYSKLSEIPEKVGDSMSDLRNQMHHFFGTDFQSQTERRYAGSMPQAPMMSPPPVSPM